LLNGLFHLYIKVRHFFLDEKMSFSFGNNLHLQHEKERWFELNLSYLKILSLNRELQIKKKYLFICNISSQTSRLKRYKAKHFFETTK